LHIDAPPLTFLTHSPTPVWRIQFLTFHWATSTIKKVESGGGEEKKTEKEEEAEAIEGDSVWQCEFCGHANQIELDEEEVLTTTHAHDTHGTRHTRHTTHTTHTTSHTTHPQDWWR
jgi:hypothetical protein